MWVAIIGSHMIKNAIAPIQAWLLSQGRCVGCGMPLSAASSKNHSKGVQVKCKCGRVYLKKDNRYRRAVLSEIK